MTDNITRLKEALEAGPTEGPWHFGTFAAGVLVVSDKRGKHDPIASTGDSSCCAIPWDSTESSRIAQNDAAFIAAANPAAIRELLERLEQAEKDARRYRWLRRSGSARLDEEREDMVKAYADHYLDQAIDAAIASQEGGQHD